MTQQTDTKLVVRDLGLQDYRTVWQAMQTFTAQRTDTTPDEFWCVQHPAVFTLGLNAKPEHLLNPENIEVINVDRGGQVTYHGPGQLVIYSLLDLNRRQLGVKDLVAALETAVIDYLAEHRLVATGKINAPGVYIGEAKIAALGLRIKRGRSYHGLSFNIDMDLSPFSRINPCGYAGMPVTQLRDFVEQVDIQQVKQDLLKHLYRILGYNVITFSDKDPA